MAIHNMNKIVSLVDRTTGRATSVVFTGNFSAANIRPLLARHMSPEARLMTDDARHYRPLGHEYADHQFVSHTTGEYVRKSDATVHSNTVEGFFSIFKKGMRAVYQHCGSQHLPRYLAEFDFRYSNRVGLGVDDNTRAALAVAGTVGRRLTYKKSHVSA